ncbi:MAG TPA: sensor histidine kinase [Vicinamibacterales bacterium]|jgi:signal transduction histidine kinase|nr:sensor histidine kinase [Vicinamibacterales bacterium]
MTLSLRVRVLLGAILWTFGLVLMSFAVIAWVFNHVPDLPFLGRHGSIHFIWGSHAILIVVTAVIAMAGGAFQVRRGLNGIARLRERLAEVHAGHESRLAGDYVPEVQPLVDDLNALLEQREQAVQRAVAKAGDLAHGLKTPLALLALEAERASASGHGDVAAALREQVARMQRQIDYHLAHARASASGSGLGARASVVESADGLARTLPRLYADRHLAIDVRVDATHAVRVQREDLDEMLGNLLDNACKWARSRVLIESTQAVNEVSNVESGSSRILVTVDDDGPGLAADMREKVLQRGVRADEQAAGSGLGLAIVRDLAEVYGGSIALSDSPLGGLRASLALPRTD